MTKLILIVVGVVLLISGIAVALLVVNIGGIENEEPKESWFDDEDNEFKY